MIRKQQFLVQEKQDEGIDDILEQIITVLPGPKGESLADLKCLLVDSWYDTYLRSSYSSKSNKWQN